MFLRKVNCVFCLQRLWFVVAVAVVVAVVVADVIAVAVVVEETFTCARCGRSLAFAVALSSCW